MVKDGNLITITFRNSNNYGKEIIGLPIMKNNDPTNDAIGAIVDVNESVVTGFIYADMFHVLSWDTDKVCEFRLFEE